MKYFFPSRTNLDEIVDEVKGKLEGRKLGKMVSLQSSGNGLEVKISKLGTSTLTFGCSQSDSGLTLELGQQKIAFSHKSFKQEVLEKINAIIVSCGGKVV